MVDTFKGRQVYICATPQANDLILDDYENLTWVEVKHVGSTGQTGADTNIVNYDDLATDVSQKQKAIVNAGDPEIECSQDRTDAGQNLLNIAARTKLYYAIKFEDLDAPTIYHTDTCYYMRGLVTGPTRPNGRNEDFNLQVYKFGLIQLEIVRKPVLAFPYKDSTTILDFDLDSNRFYSKTLGRITAAQALTTVRASTNDYAYNRAGTLVQFAAANTPRITDMGLWSEDQYVARCTFNTDPSNAAWTKTNMTLTQDLPSPLAAPGSPNGWRLKATAANATITQVVGVIPATDQPNNFTTPNCLLFLPVGDTVPGLIELSDDNFATVRDVKDQITPGKWCLVNGLTRVNSAASRTFGLRIGNSGVDIGFTGANVSRNVVLPTSILTTDATPKTKEQDMHSINWASFPALWNQRKFTVLVAYIPQMQPFIPPGLPTTNPQRKGGTVISFDNPWVNTAKGIGEITNDVLTIATWQSGKYNPNDILTEGTGVLPGTKIVSQTLSTEPGGTLMGQRGTYAVRSPLSGTPGYAATQTTFSRSAQIDARTATAQNLTLKMDVKQFDAARPYVQMIGLNIKAESATPFQYEINPQNQVYLYNDLNGVGFSVDLDAREAIASIRGDVEYSVPASFTTAPLFAAGMTTMIGNSGIVGGNNLKGMLKRLIILTRAQSGTELGVSTQAIEDSYKFYDNIVDTSMGLWLDQLARYGFKISDQRAAIVNQFFIGLKTIGAWDLLEDFWLLAGENSQQSLLSLKRRFAAIATNSPVFTADRGYTFNGTSNYLDTRFVPSTNATVMTGTNMHLAVYERSNENSTGMAAGVFSATSANLIVIPRAATNIMQVQANSTLGAVAGETAITDSKGLSVVSRNGALVADVKAYKNGVSVTPTVSATVASALPTSKLYIGARSDSLNAGANFRPCNIACVSVGAAIPVTMQPAYFSTIRALLIAIGAYP